MEMKNLKAIQKKTIKLKSIRINSEVERQAERLLNFANRKRSGRKIKILDVMSLALGLVTEEHIKILQDHSLTNEDRKELLRQKYIEKNGPISKDEFTGFMLTAEFPDFIKLQQAEKLNPKSPPTETQQTSA